MVTRRANAALPRRRSRPLALGAVLSILLGAATAGAFASPVPLTPYSSATAGSVDVTVPSLYPSVELSSSGNLSVASSWSIDQVLETSSAAPNPTVVAVALPSDVVGPNSTGGSPSFPLHLTAVLTVYPSSAGLWAGPADLVQGDAAPIGTARLFVNYTVPTAPGSSGVNTAWTVTGWPWAAANGPGDLLGLQMTVATPLAGGVVGCTRAASTAACPGPTDFGAPAGWSSGIVGFQAAIPSGPTALLQWDAASGAGVSVGILAGTASQSHLVLASPSEGSEHVAGSVDFSLLPPAIAHLAGPLVHGELVPYAAGAALAAAIGALGLLAYRRDARRVEREL